MMTAFSQLEGITCTVFSLSIFFFAFFHYIRGSDDELATVRLATVGLHSRPEWCCETREML